MPRKNDFDVIVVGARCAGAPLATFLARSGVRVLAIDKDPLPSDQVLSTHTIHPPGIAVLDEIGVGDAIRSVTPPTRTARFRKADAWADVDYLDGRAGYCPRRKRLDGLLQDAAVRAGAVLRDRARATRLLFEDDRVVGVTVEHEGRSEDIRAGLVVGADGRRSFVAEQVGAEEYLAYDAPRAMYWAYWDAPETWWTDRYPFDMYLAHVGSTIRVIFQTDDDQILVGSLPAAETARSWSSDAEGSLRDSLSEDPLVDSLLDDEPPASSTRGTLKERFFFRRGAGPGWALVGDAGHHKDYVVGDGITEALLQAKSLAEAIVGGNVETPAEGTEEKLVEGPREARSEGTDSAFVEGTDEALLRWWRARDVEALPQFYWGKEEGAAGQPGELESMVVRKVSRRAELKRRMARLPHHLTSPYDALPVSEILPVVLGGLLRGRFGVVPEFLANGRRAAEYARVLKEREELLEAVS